jgi:hypothetical protein
MKQDFVALMHLYIKLILFLEQWVLWGVAC